VPRTTAAALVAVLVPLLAACGDAAEPRPVEPAAAPAPDPAAARSGPRPEAVEGPVEVALTIPAGRLPDGTLAEVSLTLTTAGERRELVVDTPAGVVERHVMTEEEHWWWITPLARDVVDVAWVHVVLAEVEELGGDLPEPVADARASLPEPGDLDVGSVLAGYEVLDVERIGPDEERIALDGLEDPAVLRRRALPAGTTVELPADAVPLRDLPALLGT